MRSILFYVVRCMALMGLVLAAWSVGATSEPQRIYRCGNAYTNQPDPSANCKPLAGSSVTVIEGTRVQGAQTASPAANASGGTGAAKVERATPARCASTGGVASRTAKSATAAD